MTHDTAVKIIGGILVIIFAGFVREATDSNSWSAAAFIGTGLFWWQTTELIEKLDNLRRTLASRL